MIVSADRNDCGTPSKMLYSLASLIISKSLHITAIQKFLRTADFLGNFSVEESGRVKMFWAGQEVIDARIAVSRLNSIPRRELANVRRTQR